MSSGYEATRSQIRAHIVRVAESEPRITGCLDYGATGHGSGDQWSDIDLALFIRDEALDSFEATWQSWATQFGPLLLAYTSFVGHPWAVYDTGAAPLRVDFSFKRDSSIPELGALPLSPLNAQEMVLYDGTAGALTRAVTQLVGRSLEPPDIEEAFTQASGDFFTMLLRCHARMMRGHFWAARNDFHAVILPRLMALLRVESGATDRWLASNAADKIEEAVGEHRLLTLRACLPNSEDRDLARAMLAAAELGSAVCASMNQTHGWAWPELLAGQTELLLGPGLGEESRLPPVTMRPIGIVSSSVDELLRPDVIKSLPSRIIVNAALNAGLEGLEGNQRLLVVFQFNRLAGFDLLQHPKNDPSKAKRGVFALHSPQRPNPIGVTEVDLLRREGNILHVRGLDAVNGTPVLDLKLNKQRDIPDS